MGRRWQLHVSDTRSCCRHFLSAHTDHIIATRTCALILLRLQVNIPKTRRTYCKGKDCKKHTQHKVTQYKAGKVRQQPQHYYARSAY